MPVLRAPVHQELWSSRRLAKPIVVGVIFLAALLAGLHLREWTWQITEPIRFGGDLRNAFYWGTEAMRDGPLRGHTDPAPQIDTRLSQVLHGYFGVYERVQKQASDGEYYLDYPPLRLLLMMLWARHVRIHNPGVEEGSAEFAGPLRLLNLACEIASAFLTFVLVRLWQRRGDGGYGQASNGPAFAAALLVWFNPALILNSHGWPQWDVWILPIYLLAALFASLRRWLLCGSILALGGMLKGQLLLVAPFFVLLALIHGAPAARWESVTAWSRMLCALRVVAGFLFASAVLVSPWVLSNWGAWCFVAVAVTIVTLVLRWLKVRDLSVWLSLSTAAAIFTVGAFSGGSFAWLKIGLLYGTERYPYLFVSSCYNLGAILAGFGWQLKDVLPGLGDGRWSLNLQWLLRVLYLIALGGCAMAAARCARRSDTRMLIALSLPWLLMFGLLGQMHERYLLWGAVTSALAIGARKYLILFNVGFSVLSAAMILDVMLKYMPSAALQLHGALEHFRFFGPFVLLSLLSLYAVALVGRFPRIAPVPVLVQKPQLSAADSSI
jgi:hypothetical protein